MTKKTCNISDNSKGIFLLCYRKVTYDLLTRYDDLSKKELCLKRPLEAISKADPPCLIGFRYISPKLLRKTCSELG